MLISASKMLRVDVKLGKMGGQGTSRGSAHWEMLKHWTRYESKTFVKYAPPERVDGCTVEFTHLSESYIKKKRTQRRGF